MSELRIQIRDNGPFLVEGSFELIDASGQKYTLDASKPVCALCRCGQSANRPFCDGSHKACGFQSSERAPVG